MKTFFATIAITVLILSSIVVFQFLGIENYKFFAPKMENAKRQVYENTESYVQGKRQELVKYKLEYDKATDDAEKSAIKSTIIHSMTNVDVSKFEPNLESFIRELRGY